MADLLDKAVAVLLEFVLNTQQLYPHVVMDKASREAEQVLNRVSAMVRDGHICHTDQEGEAVRSPESTHGHGAGIKCMTPTAKADFVTAVIVDLEQGPHSCAQS